MSLVVMILSFLPMPYRKLNGQFILSLNAVEGVYKTFSGFDIEEVDCAYCVNAKSTKPVEEVIITSPRSLQP